MLYGAPWSTCNTLAGRAALVALLGAVPDVPADAQDEKTTTIRIVVDETHDRITPDGNLPIEKLHEAEITLSGKNAIHETWAQTNIGASPLKGHHAGAGFVEHTHADPGGHRDTAMGETADANFGQVIWHVLGAHKLQRIQSGKQLLQVWDIEIDNNNRCQIDTKYLLQKGFDFFVAYRAGTREIAHFTVPKVLRATCSIE